MILELKRCHSCPLIPTVISEEEAMLIATESVEQLEAMVTEPNGIQQDDMVGTSQPTNDQMNDQRTIDQSTINRENIVSSSTTAVEGATLTTHCDVGTSTSMDKENEDNMSLASLSNPYRLIKINVGGATYWTKFELLIKHPESSIAEKALSSYCVGLNQNEVFLDEDGPTFRYILDYLRNDCRCVLPMKDLYTMEMLIRQAQRSRLIGLLDHIRIEACGMVDMVLEPRVRVTFTDRGVSACCASFLANSRVFESRVRVSGKLERVGMKLLGRIRRSKDADTDMHRSWFVRCERCDADTLVFDAGEWDRFDVEEAGIGMKELSMEILADCGSCAVVGNEKECGWFHVAKSWIKLWHGPENAPTTVQERS